MKYHSYRIPIVFPSGVAAGDGSDENVLRIARNGLDEPILRGTAIAGVLRSLWHDYLSQEHGSDEVTAKVEAIFGRANDNVADADCPSRIEILDAVLGTENQPMSVRTHHLRNRHTKTVVDGGLFSLEHSPPDTTATISIAVRDDGHYTELAEQFIAVVQSVLRVGLSFGGSAARGVGVAYHSEVDSSLQRVFDLTKSDEYGDWLKSHDFIGTEDLQQQGYEPYILSDPLELPILTISIPLRIPRGQDILVADGAGLDYQQEPQRIMNTAGALLWRIPGSTFRGAFRSWMTRLAALDGEPIADTVTNHTNGTEEHQLLTGDNLAWCFLPKEQRTPEATTDCPIASLFGSAFSKGRILFEDCFVPASPEPNHNKSETLRKEEQHRMHVAIDAISGGAIQGALFDNTVLTSQCQENSEPFILRVRIVEPRKEEVTWFCKTLQSLNIGLLRIGSSKATGRLELCDDIVAAGPLASELNAH